MGVWLIAAALGVLGVSVMGLGFRGLARRKSVTGTMGAVTGGVMTAGGAITALVGVNLQTYERLTYEAPVAEIALARTGPKQFDATITTPDGATRTFALAGDAWQIDARVLTFHPWATVAGLDAHYRLDRLAGRYNAIAEERDSPRTVHALSAEPGLDLWTVSRTYASRQNVVDALFGSGAYLPMADGAVFEVTLSQTGGLVARPKPGNSEATDAIAGWR